MDALRILTPPALTVGLLMLRRFRPLLVALVPAAVFIGVVSIVVGLLIQGVVPGGSGALFAARPAWFSNWMLAITPLPTIAGIVIAVREIRRGVRRSVLLMLVALLIVAGIAATAGSPGAVVFAGVCVGVAINAFEVFAVWAIVTGFLRLKQRGDLPDEVLHFAFCWLALTWFTAVLAGDDRPYLGWSMLPFASCMGTLLAALAYQRRHAGMQPPKRMLLLRVFGSARTRTRLFDLLDDIWLRVGRIEVIVGLDLALRTLSALALGNYLPLGSSVTFT